MAEIVDTSSRDSKIRADLKNSLSEDELERISTALGNEADKVQREGNSTIGANAAWTHRVDASAAFAGLVYGDVRVIANAISREFHGQGWGAVIGIPAGVIIGTLGYDRVEDLTGDGVFSAWVTLPYVNITLWKNDVHVATFEGGNVGAGWGGFKGNGKWS